MRDKYTEKKEIRKGLTLEEAVFKKANEGSLSSKTYTLCSVAIVLDNLPLPQL